MSLATHCELNGWRKLGSTRPALEDCCLVIPTFQRPAELLNLLRTVDEMTGVPREILVVDGSPDESVSQSLVAWAQGRPIACLAWSSAPRHLGSRDRYIGWSAEARRRNIRFIAYNTRFLILPWVRVPHLASHLLAIMTRTLSTDWERMYHHPVYFAETFIDPGRFRGTCYRAANWVLMGHTTGRGKDDQSHKPNRPVKEVLGLPLTPRFRELLSQP